MNCQHAKYKWVAIFSAFAFCAGALNLMAAQGGPTNTKPGASTTVTNAGPPKSGFKQPNSPAEGKDPFYPRSITPYLNGKPIEVAPSNAVPVIVDVELKLGGISGSREHPLAIINGHTFEVGEEGEVNSAHGKVHVRCLEIRPDGVLVFVNGQRRELRLRMGL